MEICAFCDEESSQMIIVQIEKLLYICKDCKQALDQQNDDLEYFCNLQPLISHQNDICKKCFLNEPAFFKITSKKFMKVCTECKLLTKKKECGCPMPLFCQEHFNKGQSVVFIKIKWRQYLKSKQQLREYNQVIAGMKKLKLVFENKNRDIEKQIKRIEEIKNDLKKNIRDCILEKKSQINNYKDQVKTVLFGVSKQIKEHELIGKYSKYHRLLESTDVRDRFFTQRVIEPRKQNNIKKVLEDRFCIKLTSPAEIFK